MDYEISKIDRETCTRNRIFSEDLLERPYQPIRRDG